MGEVWIEGRRLDVMEGLDFSFNYSIADVRDPSKRSTEYSKTIKCPGTPNNDALFGHIYDVNISNDYDSTSVNVEVNFNPNKKASARVISDGVEVMSGVVQLRSITINNRKLDYEVVFIGNLKTIFSVLGDKRIDEKFGIDSNGDGIIDQYDPYIDFSDLNHLLTRENQQDSWVAAVGTGYVYPFAEYGDAFDYSNTGEKIVKVRNLKPAVYAKDIMDRIFAFAGFTYTSTFFDSALFKRLIVPFSNPIYVDELTRLSREAIGASDGNYDLLSATYASGTQPNQATDSTFVYTFETYPNETDPNNLITQGYTPIGGLVGSGYYTSPSYGNYDVTASVNYQFVRQRVIVYDMWTSMVGTGAKPSAADGSFGACTTYEINADGTVDVIYHGDSGFLDGTTATKPNAQFNMPIGVTLEFAVSNFPATDTEWVVYANESLILRPRLTNNALAIDNGLWKPTIEEPLVATIGTQNQTIALDGFEVPLQVGDEIKIRHSVNWNDYIGGNSGWGTSPPSVPLQIELATADLQNNFSLKTEGTFLSVAATEIPITEGELVDLNQAAPSMDMSDYILSIAKMFNLYITVDPLSEFNLIIETRDEFYDGGVTRDWTNKIARDKTIRLNPLAMLTAKDFEYTYSSDGDYYNERYKNNHSVVYGNREYDIDNDFLSNTNTVTVAFSSTPLVADNNSSRIIPKIYDADIDDGAKAVEHNTRIWYYGGLIDSNPDWQHLTENPNYPNGTLINNQYPYAGHWDNPLTPTLDINFGLPREIYYGSNGYIPTVQVTNANLFNVYHIGYVKEITNKDSKMLTGEFYLDALDIEKLDFRDQIVIDNAYWRINKIMNYNPFKEGLSRVELFKVVEVNPQKNSFFKTGFVGDVSDGGTTEVKPTNNRIKRLNSNVYPQFQGKISGVKNKVGGSSMSFKIVGDENVIGEGTRNISILGSNNVVISGIENVVIINSDNQEVYESNTTIIDGKVAPSAWTEVSVKIDYTASDREFVVVDAFVGAIDITLTTALDSWVAVKKEDASANVVTITPNSGTIDGAATLQILSQYDAVDFYCDGTNWFIR